MTLIPLCTLANANILINEIADIGAFNACGGDATTAGTDFIELKNNGTDSVDLIGYQLFGPEGPDRASAFTFPSMSIEAGELALLCKDDYFTFEISNPITISLVDKDSEVVDVAGPFYGSGVDNLSFQRQSDGTFGVGLATPNSVNAEASAVPTQAPSKPPMSDIAKPSKVPTSKHTWSTYEPSLAPTKAPPSKAPQTAAPTDEPGISIVINEISDKGACDACGGNATHPGDAYLELKYNGSHPIDLSGFRLHNDKGKEDAESFTFPAVTMQAGELLLLCKDGVNSFTFGIGGYDTVTLLDTQANLISTVGPLINKGSEEISYQLQPDGSYAYVEATPGRDNAEPTLPPGFPVVVNEVSTFGHFDSCGGNSTSPGKPFIELKNLGTDEADITGYVLLGSKGKGDGRAFTFPSNTMIPGEGLLLLCMGATNSYSFAVNPDDTITLLNMNKDVISSAGALEGEGTAELSFQRQPDGTYVYAYATPDAENLGPTIPPQILSVVVNEVADKGALRACGGTENTTGAPFIELKNNGTEKNDISSFVLYDNKGLSSPDAVKFPSGTIIDAGQFLLLCQGDLKFEINGDDIITLVDTEGKIVSKAGPMQNNGTNGTSFSRQEDGTYEYAPSTPGAENDSPTFPPDLITVVINEVSDKGAFSTCSGSAVAAGADYVEIYNYGNGTNDLSGLTLHDNEGANDVHALVFDDVELGPGEYLLLCKDDDKSFTFSITSGSTITLRAINGDKIAEVGPLTEEGTTKLSYQRQETGLYAYAPSTPGEENAFPLVDHCPDDPIKTEPGICGCGVPDDDSDKDGTMDCFDECPTDPLKNTTGECGCGKPEGNCDPTDFCKEDPHKKEPGICGCGIPDTDRDKDGTPDCIDQCPDHKIKTKPGVCGCSVTEIDSDMDGVPDCVDECPNIPTKSIYGYCGCLTQETDTDNDGLPDCKDECPKNPNIQTLNSRSRTGLFRQMGCK